MKSFAVLALAATAVAQSAAPAGCSPSTQGSFQISTVNVTNSRPSKRDLQARQLAGTLTLTLQNGILRDQANRIGYIASNYQFQFDAPVQAGAREQSGFSLCSNQTLALGSSAIWYSCNSGGFNNLYSRSIGAQCVPIYFQTVRQGSGGASQISDGQPQAGTPRPVVSQISDGQPQATTPRPVVTQISDGQPQAGTPRPVVSQISDGQPQAGTPRPVVSTPRPVVSQISDGQPQAGTPRPVVSQISDGQPQAPRPTGNVTRPSSPPAQFTGGAAVGTAATGAFAAGLFGLLAML